MVYTDFTEKLTGLQDLIITKVEDNEKEIHIYGEIKQKPHKCPCCGAVTDKIHDYREQKIKDIPSFGRKTIIHLRKRRYRCQCGKRFFEGNKFLPRYHRMTNRLSAYIINELANEISFTSVGRKVDLSTTTVMRVFDYVDYSAKGLPKVLSIDEFKGNTNGEKYQCIITDPVNKVVLDILPKRYESYLTQYFLGFNKSERNNVKTFGAHPKIKVPGGIKANQVVLDAWVDEYNSVRPNEAIGMKTPDEVYAVSERKYIGDYDEIDYPMGFQVRRVTRSGEIIVNSIRVTIGFALRGLQVGLKPSQENNNYEVFLADFLLGTLDMNSTCFIPLDNLKSK